MSSLRDRLRLALARNTRLSQAGLHRATGATTASVSNWFTGKSATMKAANLRTAAEYLGCSQHWLETGKGDPGWRDQVPPKEGLDIHSAAHELSQQPDDHDLTSGFQVPVIGTLKVGAGKMFELRAAPEGQPIGTVPASFGQANSHALQVFGDELYPVIRHGSCLIVAPGTRCTAGELMLLETTDGSFLVCELVAEHEDVVIWNAATGGSRQATPRTEIQGLHAIIGIVPGSQLRKAMPR